MIEGGILVYVLGEESQEIVGKRHCELGNLPRVPARRFTVCIAPNKGALAPDGNIADATERASAHVAYPNSCNNLAAKANLIVLVARMMYDRQTNS